MQILEEIVDLSKPVNVMDNMLDSGSAGPSLQVHLIFARLYHTFLVWVGETGSPSLENVSLAIGKLMTTMANEAKNAGLTSADDGAQLASRLSLKFNEGRPVYVAYNYSPLSSNVDGGQVKLSVDKAVFAFVQKCLQAK